MKPLFLIAGPCAIEDADTPLKIAREVKRMTDFLGIKYIFKGSYKKANRTRLDSFMGIDKLAALRILRSVHEELGIPVLTDVHESWECEEVAEYVDYIQIPAFLCRQTELLIAAAETRKGINIKKGQFLSPEAMKFALEKVKSKGSTEVWLTERGTTFGYESLVVDITSIPRMQKLGVPVVMDCTHAVQRPNQHEGVTGGDSEMIQTLCLAAVAAGVDGLFIETHPNPSIAKSDSASMLPLDKLQDILTKAVKIRELGLYK